MSKFYSILFVLILSMSFYLILKKCLKITLYHNHYHSNNIYRKSWIIYTTFHFILWKKIFLFLSYPRLIHFMINRLSFQRMFFNISVIDTVNMFCGEVCVLHIRLILVRLVWSQLQSIWQSSYWKHFESSCFHVVPPLSLLYIL